MGYENCARLPGKVLESWYLFGGLVSCLVRCQGSSKGKRKRQLEECLKKGRDVKKKRVGASNRVQGMSDDALNRQ